MIRTQKPLVASLGILTAFDFIAADVASRLSGSAAPPVPAIAVMVSAGIRS